MIASDAMQLSGGSFGCLPAVDMRSAFDKKSASTSTAVSVRLLYRQHLLQPASLGRAGQAV
jgi:hypothetical protein